jgi:predicted permease
MPAWDAILNRVRYFGRRSQFDEELDEEIQFHIETRADELLERGLSASAAMEQARREFGSRAQVREETRGAWQILWVEDLWRDLCYAARGASRSPGFTAIAVLSLAMGVGANCAMFIAVDAALLRPLAVSHPEEIITVHGTSPQTGSSGISYLEYLDLRDRSKSFNGLVAFQETTLGFSSGANVLPRRKDGQLITGNYFDVLGVAPALGRAFLPEEDKVPGRDAVVILSHSFWERDFGSDPAVIGRHVWISGIPFTVVGVMPRDFLAFDETLTEDYPDFFIPMMMGPRLWSDSPMLKSREQRNLAVVGRLQPGVTIQTAQQEIATLAASIEKQYPETNRQRGLVVQTVRRFRASGFEGVAGGGVMILAGLVLLVACANVAGLLSGRAASRQREIAVRLALGAGRVRLVRQLLTENLFISIGGGLLGVGLACIPLAMVRPIMLEVLGDEVSNFSPLRLDGRAWLFTLGVALVSTLIFGLAPALQATRTDLIGSISGARALRRRFFQGWGRSLLVAGQVTAAVLVLAISTVVYLFVRESVTAIDAGFDTKNIYALSFDPIIDHYQGAELQRFYEQIRKRLNDGGNAIAVLASAAESVPIHPVDGGANQESAAFAIHVDQNFFDSLAIPILRGRAFRPEDPAGSADLAVVNRNFADRHWPHQDPIGKSVTVGADHRKVQIAGVSAIRSYDQIGTIGAVDLVFLPSARGESRHMTLYVRSFGDTAAMTTSVRNLVHEIDPRQAAPNLVPWGAGMQLAARGFRLAAQIIAAMGLMGIFLALVGMYGMVSYDVSTGTREIGIRMALGASQLRLLFRAVRKGLILAGCGVAVGWLLNSAAFDLLFSVLPQANNSPGTGGVNLSFSNMETTAFVITILVLVMLAAYIPARRAVSVDPGETLRCDS